MEFLKNILAFRAILLLARDIITFVAARMEARKREQLISHVEEILSAGDFMRPHRPPPKV